MRIYECGLRISRQNRLNCYDGSKELGPLLRDYRDNAKGNLEQSQIKRKGFPLRVYGFCQETEKEGKAGSYIARFKKVIISWLKFNEIRLQLIVNTSDENETPTIANKSVPSKEEQARIIRKATSGGRVAIAIMAFTGLRPESLGDYEGKGRPE